ncbi:hypothetical protein BASA81_014064 [Batrachochytrium salamandrivorans]|nr:hypothetical protein BASA81_014064 [Batrachochytrium salamandrivorans]
MRALTKCQPKQDNSLAKLLALCGSTSPSPMQGFNFGGDLIKKIGEASYSDVYSMWMKTESGGKDLDGYQSDPRWPRVI